MEVNPNVAVLFACWSSPKAFAPRDNDLTIPLIVVFIAATTVP